MGAEGYELQKIVGGDPSIPPLLGGIESAVLMRSPLGGYGIAVQGWLISSVGPIVLMHMGLGGSQIVVAEPYQRPDIAAKCPGFPDALNSGFRAYVPVPGAIKGTVLFYVSAILSDGLTLAATLDAPVINGVGTQVVETAAEDEPNKSRSTENRYESVLESETARRKIELNNFLASGEVLDFWPRKPPLVSIVVVLFNRAELTYACLRSLERTNVPFELILVDNNSSDATGTLLKQLRGAQIIENKKNLHYLTGCNQGASQAGAEFTLLLNNDVTLLPSTLPAALAAIQSASDIGAVGGRIVRPDGRLQEAGSFTWRDGSTCGYGAGDDPEGWRYLFRRDVDYCSGAFLLVRTKLFHELGMFNPAFSPAYYEDADFCLRLRSRGYRTVYEPQALLFHSEHSSSDPETARKLQLKNRAEFLKLHGAYLNTRPMVGEREDAARFPTSDKKAVLFIEDQIPLQSKGSGFPRSQAILKALDEMGYRISFYPTLRFEESVREVYSALPPGVELIPGFWREGFRDFLNERKEDFDFIVISRAHNMEAFFRAVREGSIPLTARIIYDAEALSAFREIGKKEVHDELVLVPDEVDYVLEAETKFARVAEVVWAVSALEAEEFRRRGCSRVDVISTAVETEPTPKRFGERSNLLTVGPLYEPDTPNADGLAWFTENVLPLLTEDLLPGIVVRHAGINRVEELHGKPNLSFLGEQKDLFSLYNQSRVFVAPTRYSAGIPLKVIEAAAYGLPVVASKLLAHQLGWRDGIDLLAADSAVDFAVKCKHLYESEELWNAIRENALRRVQEDYGTRLLKRALQQSFSRWLTEGTVGVSV